MALTLKRVLVLVTGWAFIAVGIVGLFLPVLQGVLCILIGLIILSAEYHWARRLLEKVKARFPGVARASHEASEKAKVWLHRISGRTSHSG